jgi:hypothetical protein
MEIEGAYIYAVIILKEEKSIKDILFNFIRLAKSTAPIMERRRCIC